MLKLNNNDKIIVFKTYINVTVTEIDKSKLDDAGIECFLTDLNTALIGKYHVYIRLHIFEKDFSVVNELINSK
jgi:hypothetical protein